MGCNAAALENWPFFNKLNIKSPCDPAMPLLRGMGTYGHTMIFMTVDSSIIRNGPKVEMTHQLVNG